MDYAVMISYEDPDNTGEIVSLILDTVEDTDIAASSTVTQHPTVHGTPMADHMYKNPITIGLRGTFSLNGKKGIVYERGHGSLARVEQMFERIKNDGILCSIVKVKVDESKTPQFSIRENMVLESINWKERINSLDFTFAFVEALRADVQTYQVDPDDKFAPDIEYPDASNFSDTLLDWNKVDEEVLQALLDYDLLDAKFCNYLNTLGYAGMAALVTVSIAAIAGALVSLGVISAIPGGIIVAAVVAVVAFFVLGIAALIKALKRKAYKIKAFEYYKNQTKADNEVKRFLNFYEDVHDKVRSLDGVIKCFNVTENKPQETIVSIGGSYYIFNFEKNNLQSDYAYKVTISDTDDRVLKNTNVNIALSSYTDGTPENALFVANGWYVYLICPSQIEDAKSDLTKYIICASQINPQDFGSALAKIIQEAIKY